MKLSDKRKQELYSAISARIMDLRVELKMNPDLSDLDKLDARLFKLEQEIWPDVKQALNLTD